MEREEYEIMYDVEDKFWRYKGLRGLAFMCLDKLKGKSKDISLLDAGCGTGKLLESCDLYRIFGLEVSERAIEFVKLRH